MAVNDHPIWTAKIDGITGGSKISGAEGHINVADFQELGKAYEPHGNLQYYFFQMTMLEQDRTNNVNDINALINFARNSKKGYVIKNFTTFKYRFYGDSKLGIVEKIELKGAELVAPEAGGGGGATFTVKATSGTKTPFTTDDSGVLKPGTPIEWDLETYVMGAGA